MQHAELIKCLSHVHFPLFSAKRFPACTLLSERAGRCRKGAALPNDLQPAVITAHGGLRPLWLCVPAFQQVCQTLLDLLVRSVQALSRRKRGRKNFRFDRTNEKRFADPVVSVFYHELSVKTRQVTRQNSKKVCKI